LTVLFADLVGFTSRAERMDPEDVRELLSPYYARLRGDPRRQEHLPGDAARDRVREADPVEAKGKEERIPVWEALQPRASFGVDVPLEARTALVGCERELGVVRDALDRVREERSPQLVTLVGVPGIGKSQRSGRDRLPCHSPATHRRAPEHCSEGQQPRHDRHRT